MPAASNNRAQQTYAMASNNLLTNNEIWSSSFSRNQPAGSRESDENTTGSSALNANSEGKGWGSNPWNTERPPRSPSTSPQRTRDGGLQNGSAFFDTTQTSVPRRTGLGNQYEPNGYNVFGVQRRSPDTSFMDSVSTHAQRDSIPSSRHSQGSPASFGDVYGHAPSNSIQSQRQMPTQVSGYQNQNQRAFNLNQHVDDLEIQLSRASLDRASNGTTAFNPATQPFQMNTNSRPYLNDSSVPRFSSLDSTAEAMTGHYQSYHRASVDRISPVSNYRINQGNNSPQSYAPSADLWPSNTPSRDTRAPEAERRPPTQLQLQQPQQQYQQSFYPNQYYQQYQGQFSPALIDPSYLRQNLIPGYSIPLHPAFQHGLIPNRPAREQDSGKGMRSAILEEFRVNAGKSNKRFELKDIYNHVVEFSGDQHGSRFIQQKLEGANSDEKDRVFKEIEPNAIQLMKDVFGNYVIQKFYEHGDQIQKKILTDKIKGKVYDLSTQVYACRVVQKALDFMLVEQQAQVAQELAPRISDLMRDQHGNHVAQKIIEVVPRPHWEFVMTIFRGRIPDWSTNSFACRVVQRALEKGTDEDKAEIMDELNGAMQMLVMDQFGNYVMQHVIKTGEEKDRDRVIELVTPQAIALSKHKFASNVVERCIQFGNPDQRRRILGLVKARGSEGFIHLQTLLKDQYANYVIQRLLKDLEGEELEIFIDDVKPFFFAVKKSINQKQVEALEELLGLTDETASSKNGGSINGASRNRRMDVNSSTPTPDLTNETNSPQSNSPQSANVSAVGVPVVDGGVKTNGVGSPRVRSSEV
ncbi:Fc.00g110720.m01.CDS01 [Cosmosporella sp. VM-42]